MRARRGWAAVVAVVAVAVVALGGLSGWWFLARHPELVPGSVSAARGGVTLATGGDGPHYLLESPGTGTVSVSVLNAGRVAFTLEGWADGTEASRPGGAFSPFSHVRWGAPPPEGGTPTAVLGTEPVRVPPGREATVEVGVRAPPCLSFMAGSALTVRSLSLRVSSLGVSSVVEAPLRDPITVHFAGAHAKSPSCH